jgi:hypothetical protein
MTLVVNTSRNEFLYAMIRAELIKREKKGREPSLPNWINCRGDKTEVKGYEEMPLCADTPCLWSVRNK